MAWTDDKRNVVVIYAQDPSDASGLWRASAIKINDDATVTAVAAVTDVSLSGVKQKIRQPYAPGGVTPENSAPYATDQILAEVTANENQLIA